MKPVRFGEFVLDPGARELRRRGNLLHLSPKAFDLLSILVAHRPDVVSKEAIRERLWPGTNVVDANLNNLASEIRSALEDDAQRPRYLRTVHRVGYAFCGDAIDAAGGGRDPLGWLIWNERRFPLDGRRAIAGRDPGCEIWIDAPGVSRRHAAISWDASRALISDLDSTNGTFVDGTRVRSEVLLSDGQAIAMGEATLVYRAASRLDAPTKKIRRAGRGPDSPREPRE